MPSKDIIRKKIIENNRSNIVYIHPIISNEEIVKYISAFSNLEGGIIVFGIQDDGVNLWVKRSVFDVIDKEHKLRKLIDTDATLVFGELEFEGNRIEYIIIEKAEDTVRANGIIYKINKKTNKPEPVVEKNLFISYCQRDSNIADSIEEKISGQLKNVNISRDIRDVQYKESFSEFMHSIGKHDFVITIVSDRYLKSRNCMYEVVEIMRDRNFIDKLFYIVIFEEDRKFYNQDKDEDIKADIYTIEGQTKYITYWQTKENELRKIIRELEDPILTNNHGEELKVIVKIKMEIQDFMKLLRDLKAIPFGELLDSNFKEIIDCIN